MKCNEIADVLVEYRLGELSEEGARKVAAHLDSGCAECNRLDRELSSGIEATYQTLAAPKLSGDLLESTFQRVITDQQPSVSLVGVAKPASSVVARRATFVNLGSLVGATAAGLLLMMQVLPLPDAIPVVAVANDTPQREPVKSTESGLSGFKPPTDLRMSEKRFQTTKFVSFRGDANTNGPSARFVWDPLTGEVHFFGEQLPPIPSDHRLVLWTQDPLYLSYAHSVLDVDSDGSCTAVLASGTTAAPRLVVTEESQLVELLEPSQRIVLESARPWPLPKR